MLTQKRLLLLLLPVCLISIKGYSSDSSNVLLKRNVAFATFGGKENFASVNYERIFRTGKKLNWSFSAGVQPFDLSDKFSLPVSINTFTRGAMHHVELDVTITFYMDKFHPYNGGWKEDFNKQLYVSPFVCYRFQKDRGIVFKTGAGPQILFDPPSDNIVKLKTRVLKPSIFGSLGISF